MHAFVYHALMLNMQIVYVDNLKNQITIASKNVQKQFE